MQHLPECSRRVVLSILIVIVSTATLSIAAAAPHQQTDSVPTLRVAMPAPENLDPSQTSRFDPHTRDLIENLFLGLTRFNPVTHTTELALARHWSVSDDSLTWTFELREDVYWTSYNPDSDEIEVVRHVVAGDMVYAIQRACDPLRPSPVTANLMAIRGCLTVSSAFPEVINDIFIAREIGVRATGPYTLEIDLLFPISYFPSLLSTPELRPLPRETLTATQALNPGQQIMSNGPYAITAWSASGMTLVRNPLWPDPIAGNIEQVNIVFTNEATTAPALIASDWVDVARLASDQIMDAQTTQPDLFTSAPGNSALMLGYSLERAVVENVDARRALSLAIDREALARAFFDGHMSAAEHFTPANVVAAPQPGYTLYDPAAARSALERAGFAECNNIPEPVILLVPDHDPRWIDIGNAIIGQWSDVLGCNPVLFEVRPIPRTLLIELSHANYDPERVTRSHIWLFTWNADYPDAHGWTNDALHCRYGYIRNGRECDAADRLLDQAAVADSEDRTDFYTQAEELFFGPGGSYPVAPLFVETNAWLLQPRLQNMNSAGSARYDLWSLSAE